MTAPSNMTAEETTVCRNSAARAKAPWRRAVLLALTAAASGMLLTGVSMWFLGAVALAGLGPAAFTFNFHIPAALVRLFALGRTACKYGERVVGHRAALIDQVKRRAALFAAMALAPATRAVSWQLGNQDRLADYLDDVEDMDFARLRVGMPAAVFAAGAVALLAATIWYAPLALIPIAATVLVVGATLRRSLPRIARRSAAVRRSQRSAGAVLGAGLAAIVPLKAERSFANVAAMAFAQFRNGTAEQWAQARSFALIDAMCGLLGPLAATTVLIAAWQGGYRGAALLLPAFLAFSWLAFGDSATAVSRIVVARIREQIARRSLDDWQAGASATASAAANIPALRRLALINVPHQTPDGRSLGAPFNLTFEAGRPTALTGASGVGKTTLLKQIAGWIGDTHEGRFNGDGVVLLAARRRALTQLCLHDAAVLADTVRANLFAPNAADGRCWAALAAVELDARVGAAGGLDAWITQDMLSLGEAQRLNLARALLCEAPLVLFDEPTEHLDSEQGRRILHRVLSELSDRIVVYSSHDEDAIEGVCFAL